MCFNVVIYGSKLIIGVTKMDNKNIASALLKAQTEIMTAGKDAKNPFFKSKYATLNSVWEAVKEPLHDNELSLLQPISIENNQPVVKTILLHTSGEMITSDCPIICAKQNDPQALGSAITYARRYSMASLLGVMTDEDDDGEKAMNRKQQTIKMATQEQLQELEALEVDFTALCKRFKLSHLSELTFEQAEKAIVIKKEQK